METPPSRRAAEVLDRLAGEQGVHRARSGWSRAGLRPVVALAVVGVVAAVGVALVLDRRPAPVEERLPTAADEAAASAPVPEGGAVAAPDGGADPASGGGGTGEAGPVLVHVAGAVAAPGVVELPGGSRVVDAVEAGGGLRPDADADRVNLAALLVDGQRVVIPVRGQPVPEEVLPSGPGSASSGGTPGSGPGGGTAGPVDLNTASAEQLDVLPGVGPATAAAIVAHREQHGPFRVVDDLIEVRGIGEAKLDALRDLVTVGGAG